MAQAKFQKTKNILINKRADMAAKVYTPRNKWHKKQGNNTG